MASQEAEAAKFIGARISIEMIGGMGYFQGTVVEIDNGLQHLKLAEVIHDGRPTTVKEMKFSAPHIKSMEVLNYRKAAPDAGTASNSSTAISSGAPDVTATGASNITAPPPLQEEQDPIKLFLLSGSAVNAGNNDGNNFIQPSTPTKKNLSSSKSLPPSADKNTPLKVDATRSVVKQPLTKTNNENDSNKQRPTTLDAMFKGQNRSQLGNRSMPQRNEKFTESPHHGRYGGPSSKKEIQRQKNRTTFGEECQQDDMNQEFDFESNNKLFDKQAVAREISELQQQQQPDVVSQTEKRRQPQLSPSDIQQPQQPLDVTVDNGRNASEAKFRCDQNVLPNSAYENSERNISLPPEEPVDVVYTTDYGFLVPGLSTKLRSRLLSVAAQFGYSVSRQLEVTGRAAAELCLQLLGGEHRLDEKNSHQKAHVAVLCGNHNQGGLGMVTARQLLTHDINTTVVTPPHKGSLPYITELGLYEHCEGKLFNSVTQLPTHMPYDLILDARLETTVDGTYTASEWVRECTSWAARQRCPVVALDPPGHDCPPQLMLQSRALVVPGLPLVYSPKQGLPYLVKLPLPMTVWTQLGILYRSPFRSKFMVTLHQSD